MCRCRDQFKMVTAEDGGGPIHVYRLSLLVARQPNNQYCSTNPLHYDHPSTNLIDVNSKNENRDVIAAKPDLAVSVDSTVLY
jgi:hypothetical protein